MADLEIHCSRLQELVETGVPVRLIDCREPDEHEIGHLPGSELIPLGQIASEVPRLYPSKDTPLVIYCHHGMRSLRAATLLATMGYHKVCSLAGGIDRWSIEIDPSIKRY